MRWPWRRRPPELEPREAYDLWSADYGEPPNALQRLEQTHLEEMTPALRGQRVLDLGCGRGRVLASLAGQEPARRLGVDLSLGMLARWLAPGVPRLAADVEQLPLRSGTFDFAVAALVLGHLPALDRVLPTVLDLLRPGGRLLLSDFHPAAVDHGWRRTFSTPGDGAVRAVRHHPHTLEDYWRPLRDRGWQLEEQREPRWEGVPVLLLMRWRHPARAGEGSAP